MVSKLRVGWSLTHRGWPYIIKNKEFAVKDWDVMSSMLASAWKRLLHTRAWKINESELQQDCKTIWEKLQNHMDDNLIKLTACQVRIYVKVT